MNQEIIQKAPGDFTWSLFGKYQIFNKLYFTVTSPWGCEATMLRVQGEHAPVARRPCSGCEAAMYLAQDGGLPGRRRGRADATFWGGNASYIRWGKGAVYGK